jgi:hypothetical protein
MMDAHTESLMARYFTAEITEAESCELLNLVRSDDAARAAMIAHTRCQRELRTLHREEADARRFEKEVMLRLEPDGVESAAFVAGVLAKAVVGEDAAHVAKRAKPLLTRFFPVPLALAASLAILGAGAWLWQSRDGEAPSMPLAHVAVVTSVAEGANAKDYGVGEALAVGRQIAASGRMSLGFANGAQLVLEDGARLELVSASRARLIAGRAAAHVPEGAQGFTIETPSVEVVDLGTEFGVSVNEAGESDVHVFKGLVEARLPGDGTQPGSLVELGTDQGRRFTRDADASDALVNAADFPPPPTPLADDPRAHGAVHFLRQPPVSVETGRLQSDEFILLFREREHIDLDRETLVTFVKPGRYLADKDKPRAKVAPSKRISSYLVHYDPVRRAQAHRREGSVTFSGQILGVLIKDGPLNLSDQVLGHPFVIYDRDEGRGSERKKKNASGDEITLSKDRRTLHFNLAVKGDLDQIRVIVAEPSEKKKAAL